MHAVAGQRGRLGLQTIPAPPTHTARGSQPRLIPPHKDTGAPRTSTDRPTNQGWVLDLEHHHSARRISFPGRPPRLQEIRPMSPLLEKQERFIPNHGDLCSTSGATRTQPGGTSPAGGELKAREGRIRPGPTVQQPFWAPHPGVQPRANSSQKPWSLPPRCVGLPSKGPDLGALSPWGTRSSSRDR